VKTKGVVISGWVGGYTDTEKSQKVSVYDVNWHRIGQYGLNQIKLMRRSNRLCVAIKLPWRLKPLAAFPPPIEIGGFQAPVTYLSQFQRQAKLKLEASKPTVLR
jgi:hypothetical protein